MNTAEIKLQLFRQIDALDEAQLEMAYNQIIAILKTPVATNVTLQQEVRKALDDAFDIRNSETAISNQAAKKLTAQKFPHLFD
jgi:hypothetical protein